MATTRESAAPSGKLIAATTAKQHIGRGQLTIYADRGSSMTSKLVAFLLAGLTVIQSHSRPVGAGCALAGIAIMRCTVPGPGR